MSWIFFAGTEVYKLKKPVRFPYLDFSTLDKRRDACLAELMLNRRLAPDVYKSVVPLSHSEGGLAIDGSGEIVDWLVVMRRLQESQTLEQALLSRQITTRQLDPFIDVLAHFYRRAERVSVPPATLLSHWRRSLSENRRVLLDPRLGLPVGVVRRIDRIQMRFLSRRRDILADRARRHSILEGHGDLRPEHIWLGPPVRIIDCLEFNRDLRTVDPMDEIAFLCVECARLGDASCGDYIWRRIRRLLSDGMSSELFAFYRCYRATLRARLTIAHLLEPTPRTPAKWPELARSYLKLALADGVHLERVLDRPIPGGRNVASRGLRCSITACC